jgi:predicted Ser/Thr protein kinase
MDPVAETALSHPETLPSRWLRATRDDREALGELAGSYWYCVYAWWRRAGFDADLAATATLACFTRWITEAPPRPLHTGGGRMREWLPVRLTELSAQVLQQVDEPAIAIEPAWAEERYAEEPQGEPELIFQRRWAVTILEFTMEAVRAEYATRGQEALFVEVSPFAGFEGGDEEHYTAAANRVGMTVGGMRKAVFDFRTSHREVLRAFVADTVADPADVDSEITALLCACDAPGVTPASMPTVIRQHKPDELLARAMRTVQMSSAGAGQWTPPSETEIERLFPQYEMLGMLGRGGMGAVYKARQRELDRCVAIKLLPLEVSVDKDFADRFRREARAMARLHHPNIITVFDFGTTAEGHLFFAMEFVEGVNLADAIHREGLTPAQTLSIAEQVCTALAYAHGKGIVHRDIKPANVMLSTEGQVKVADFGLARLTDPTAEQMGHTMTGTVMGTPDYMAPEQMRGMNVDHRADIYSLGVMLYEMLCKEVPKGIFDPPSHRTGCDARIDRIVIRAMAQSPDRRYQSTHELKADVTAARTSATMAVSGSTQMVEPRPAAKHALAAPKAGAMQTAAPAAAKKSRLPLYGGIAAAVLAIIGGAIFLAKPKTKRSVSSTLYDAPDTASTAPVAPRVAAGKTTDLLPLLDLQRDAVAGEWRMDKGRLLSGKSKNARVELPVEVPAEYDFTMVFTISEPYAAGGQAAQILAKGTASFVWMMGGTRGTAFAIEKVNGANANSPENQTVKIRPNGMSLTKHTSRVEVREGSVRTWLDGELMADLKTDFSNLSIHDPWKLRKPGKLGVGSFDSLMAIEKLELTTVAGASLRDADKAGSAGSQSAALEPGAIRLFDTPETVGLKNGGAKLQDGVLVLGGPNGGSVGYGKTPSRDATFRASVRTTPELKNFALRIRDPGFQSTEAFYHLGPGTGLKDVVLYHNYHGVGRRLTQIKAWPLPRTYGVSDWLQLEVHATGEELTIYADGQKLGTVRDTQQLKPGGVGLFASHAEVRDVVYVPLDKASPTASPGAALEPGAITLWDTEAKIAALPKSADVRWENGAIVMTASQNLTHNVPSRDAIIRAAIRRVSGKSHANIGLRAEPWKSGAGLQSHYRLQPDFEQNKAVLHCVTPDKSLVFLKNWPLPPAKPGSEWVELELRAVGETLTVVIDGQTLGSVQDTKLTEPGGALIYGDKGSAFRDIVFVPLDPTGSAPGTTAVPAAASEPWRDWIAETRAAGKLEKLGFADDGTLARARAPMGADWPHILTARDGAIRATWKLLPEIPGGSKEHYIALRQTAARGPGAAKYLALVRPDGVRLRHFQIDAAGQYRERDIAHWPLPAGFDRAQEHTLELRAVAELLTVILNGKVLGTAQDSTIQEGAFAFFAAPDTAMRKMEYLSLAAPVGAAAAGASATPAEVQTFAGHRYQFVPGKLSWAEAKVKAEAMGGHLAVISTKEEFDWVVKTFRGPLDAEKDYSSLWLGAMAQSAGAGWKWEDGEPADVILWAPNQPDVGKPQQGDYPAYLNLHRAGKAVGFNDSSDGATEARHWRNEIIGFLVEWDAAANAGPNASTPTTPVAAKVPMAGPRAILDASRSPAGIIMESRALLRDGASRTKC